MPANQHQEQPGRLVLFLLATLAATVLTGLPSPQPASGHGPGDRAASVAVCPAAAVTVAPPAEPDDNTPTTTYGEADTVTGPTALPVHAHRMPGYDTQPIDRPRSPSPPSG